jgi:hypothetical protein
MEEVVKNVADLMEAMNNAMNVVDLPDLLLEGWKR